MKISQRSHGQVTVLIPHGPLTTDETADLHRASDVAAAAPGARTVIDLSDVPYLDSGGIEFLLNICGPQTLSRQRVKLAGLTDCVRDVLDITDVLGRMEVFTSVDDAIRSCRR